MKTSWNNFWKSFCVFFKLIWLSNLPISTWLLSKVFRLRVLGLLIQIIIHYISSSTTIEFFSTKDFTPLSLKKDLTLFENTLLSDTCFSSKFYGNIFFCLFFLKDLDKDCDDTFICTSFHSFYFLKDVSELRSYHYLFSKIFCHKWIIVKFFFKGACLFSSFKFTASVSS